MAKLKNMKRDSFLISLVVKIAIVLAIFIFIKKKIFNNVLLDVAATGQQAVIDEIIVPSNLSLSKAELKQNIEDLFGYMSGFGTKEKKIFEMFEELEGESILYIFKNFGLRRFFGGTKGGFLGNKINLASWLKKELSSRKKSKYSIYRLEDILKSKGVNLL